MSSDGVPGPALRVAGLGKRYTLGARRGHTTVREAIYAMPRRLRHRSSARPSLWALRNVSFEARPGEVIGLVGRNGAGKSTLLKVLSRITDPTEGWAEINGTVGSLLEVGSGFHPELSGRDNIYLNGAVLGMRRSQIDRSFDAIVSFAEVEPFLDTPVKRYSTGMHLRLAFAVAAHLETAVLFVDEVLAVGDAAFQQKCLGKMDEVGRSGRTVMFVSHNLGAIRSMCPRSLLLRNGEVVADGPTGDVLDLYLRSDGAASASGVIDRGVPRTFGTDDVWLDRVTLRTQAGDDSTTSVYLGDRLDVELDIEVRTGVADAVLEVAILTLDGTYVTTSMSTDGGGAPWSLDPGHHRVRLSVDVTLVPRNYTFLVGVHRSDGTTLEWVERSLEFEVLNLSRDGRDSFRWLPPRGYVRPAATWSVETNGAET